MEGIFRISDSLKAGEIICLAAIQVTNCKCLTPVPGQRTFIQHAELTCESFADIDLNILFFWAQLMEKTNKLLKVSLPCRLFWLNLSCYRKLHVTCRAQNENVQRRNKCCDFIHELEDRAAEPVKVNK